MGRQRHKPCVIIESPYKGRGTNDDVDRNVEYLQACIRDCLDRGEAPFASHQMFTGALDDGEPAQRKLGMEAGFAWHRWADYMVVYEDRGISPGMERGIEHATVGGLPVKRRRLGGEWAT